MSEKETGSLAQGYAEEARARAARIPEYEAGPMLRDALERAVDAEDHIKLAGAALDLAEPEVFEAVAMRCAGQRADPHWGPLRARAESMLNLTVLPEPARPRDWSPVAGRVAYVLYSSLPWISTGYAIRSHSLASTLRQTGVDLHCLTRPGFPWEEDPGTLSAPIPLSGEYTDEIGGVPYIRRPDPVLGLWSNYGRYIGESADVLTLSFLDLRPQVVMAASNHVCALPALIAARRLGLPMIYDMRGFWELSRVAREPEFLGTPQYRFERYQETQVARHASHVFTLSGSMRAALIERGIMAERVTFLPNGCDPERFAPAGRSLTLRGQMNLPPDVSVIGYTGSFPVYEGLEDLINAAAALKASGHTFRLLLVGDEKGTGIDGLPVTEQLRRRAGELGLEDWLVMPGRVPYEQVPEWLDLIDIAVFPRRPLWVTEMVAPLKPVEAMAAGKAVVVSSVGGMQDIVQSEKTGLVFEKGCVMDLQRQIARILEDQALRTRLGRAAQVNACKKYTWTSIAEQMRARLQRLGLSA